MAIREARAAAKIQTRVERAMGASPIGDGLYRRLWLAAQAQENFDCLPWHRRAAANAHGAPV
jgi:hypothetical protein